MIVMSINIYDGIEKENQKDSNDYRKVNYDVGDGDANKCKL